MEVAGRRHNARILEYHSATRLRATEDEVAWCSSFACWCMEQAGVPSTRSAAARSWLEWGEPLDAPRPGAVAVFTRGANPNQGHMGFVIGAEATGDIWLLGGNQDNAVSVKLYPRGRLLGLRWPGQSRAPDLPPQAP